MTGVVESCANTAANFEAIYRGQPAIQEHDVRVLGLPSGQGLGPVDRGQDIVPLAPQ